MSDAEAVVHELRRQRLWFRQRCSWTVDERLTLHGRRTRGLSQSSASAGSPQGAPRAAEAVRLETLPPLAFFEETPLGVARQLLAQCFAVVKGRQVERFYTAPS